MAVEHDIRMAFTSLRHMLRHRKNQLAERRRRTGYGRRRPARAEGYGRRDRPVPSPVSVAYMPPERERFPTAAE